VVPVAKQLESMTHKNLWGGETYMRPQDHQLIQDVHILVQSKDGVTFDFDNSGYGMVVEDTVKMASADSPTTCKMERP